MRRSRDPRHRRGRQLRGQRQAVGVGRDDPRFEHRLYRRIRRQCRAAGDRDRSRNVGRGDPMAGQRLHALPVGVCLDRRRGGRPVRPPPHLRRRHCDLCRRVDLVRLVAEHRAIDPGARHSGRRRRAVDSVLARDHRRDLRRRRARQGDRHLGRFFRDCRCRRPAIGRLDRRSRDVALDLPDQPAARAADPMDRDPQGSRKPRRRRQRRPWIGVARCSRWPGSAAWPSV